MKPRDIKMIDEGALVFEYEGRQYYLPFDLYELKEKIAAGKMVPVHTDEFDVFRGHRTHTRMARALPEDVEVWDIRTYIAENPNEWKTISV